MTRPPDHIGASVASTPTRTTAANHARGCDSCLCMACRHIVDCPVYGPGGTREVSGNPIRNTRCVDVCSSGLAAGRGSGLGRPGNGMVTPNPLRLLPPLRRTENGSFARLEGKLDTSAALGLCGEYAPEIPIEETPHRSFGMMANAMGKKR